MGLLEQVEEADSASIAETVTLLLKPLQTGSSSFSLFKEPFMPKKFYIEL